MGVSPSGLWLPDLPSGTFVSFDTETSGLYVDGNWASQVSKCQPPARVATVSMAARLNEDWGLYAAGDLWADAFPFDQGTYRGKPGRWNYETNSFDILDYPCLHCGQQPNGSSHTRKSKPCEYLPNDRDEHNNLTVDDWLTLCQWLDDKSLVLANA